MKKHSLKEFNPSQTARLDTRMWQAYYQHRFGKLVFLLVRLMHTQFGLGWLQSIKAAYYSGRAASNFRKNSKTRDYADSLVNLEVFYKYIRKHSLEDFNAQNVAELEFKWWLVHRYPTQYNQSLEAALAYTMAALYNMKSAPLKNYAKYRAKAMHVRDIATWQTKTEPDWTEIENQLLKSYEELKKAITK